MEIHENVYIHSVVCVYRRWGREKEEKEVERRN
jgi:hypothetical protein